MNDSQIVCSSRNINFRTLLPFAWPHSSNGWLVYEIHLKEPFNTLKNSKELRKSLFLAKCMKMYNLLSCCCCYRIVYNSGLGPSPTLKSNLSGEGRVTRHYTYQFSEEWNRDLLIFRKAKNRLWGFSGNRKRFAQINWLQGGHIGTFTNNASF